MVTVNMVKGTPPGALLPDRIMVPVALKGGDAISIGSGSVLRKAFPGDWHRPRLPQGSFITSGVHPRLDVPGWWWWLVYAEELR